jgi:hypothetical protein
MRFNAWIEMAWPDFFRQALTNNACGSAVIAMWITATALIPTHWAACTAVGGASWGDVRFVKTNGWDGRTKWVRVVEGDRDNGVWISLENGNVGSYEALAFWLRQNWGANDFLVGLKSTNTAEVKVPITHYTAVTTQWVYVVIPLADFRGVEFSAMENISFTFNTPGSFWIDEVRFVRLERELAPGFVLEAEQADGYAGGNTNDYKPAASQTYVLGNSWGSNVSDHVWFTVVTTGELNGAYLDVRYACNVVGGRNFNVLVQDQVRANWNAQYTEGWGEEASHFREDTLWLGTHHQHLVRAENYHDECRRTRQS